MDLSLARTFDALPRGALIAIGVMAAVQLSLQIFGLFDLARRDAVAGGRRWLWALVIVLGGFVGAAAAVEVFERQEL